jgi:Domain of unknown function (DUF397)
VSGLTAGHDPETPDSGSRWIKSSLSMSNGNCVEVTRLADGQIGVRDSKNPHGAILRFTFAGWRAFLAGARRGEFDGPGQPAAP